MELTKSIYEATAQFPKTEIYGLAVQMRRSSVSVPSNIAEGHNRDSSKEFLRFPSIAQGSLAELETQITLSQAFAYIPEKQAYDLLQCADEVGKMIRGLQSRINENLLAPSN